MITKKIIILKVLNKVKKEARAALFSEKQRFFFFNPNSRLKIFLFNFTLLIFLLF